MVSTLHDSSISLKAASERFFRLYNKYCIGPDADSLFNLLNAIHSLNDKLNSKGSGDFFEENEFIALKALRNFFHHQEELINEIKIIPINDLPEISTDTMYLCLVHKNFINNALLAVNQRHREKSEIAILDVLLFYEDIVDINPCIFNFAVKVFEKVNEIGLVLVCKEYEDYRDSYEFEDQQGISHFVEGVISCHAGNINEVLTTVYAIK